MLINEEKSIGAYKVEFEAISLQSGIYFYRLQVYQTNGEADDFAKTKKMTLIK